MTEESSYLGEGSRLAVGPSAALAGLAFAHELDGAEYLWDGLGLADLAHTIVLLEAGVVPDDEGRELVAALLEIQERPLDETALDPSVGDVYNNREQQVRALAPEATGWLPTGRARREATTIAWQLACRDRLAGLGRAVADLQLALADVAEHHHDTVMPDFTYLQHAHPTTLGHYLLAHAGPIGRHHGRIVAAFELANRSPAGSGSVNGSSIPMDRHRLAELLDFDGLIANTRDAMWAPDMALDQLHAIAQILTSVDRLAEELQIWCTEEFGFVTLADRHCRTSVIMPQKKNPYALSYLRGIARFLIPTVTSVTATMLTPTGQPENRTFAYLWTPRALDETTLAVTLLAEVVREATFDAAALAAGAGTGFVEATEVCDELTLRHGISNRRAHRVVGLAVRLAIDDGRGRLASSDLASANAELGLDLPVLTDQELDEIADPRSIIDKRATIGGAGPSETAAMIADARREAAGADSHWSGIDTERTHPAIAEARRLLGVGSHEERGPS